MYSFICSVCYGLYLKAFKKMLEIVSRVMMMMMVGKKYSCGLPDSLLTTILTCF